ncbi:MAG: hypothetical protein Q8867_02695 [Bacteroidota bacterium]|nr:hypothetical protein [Bacteroidota bacterium]
MKFILRFLAVLAFSVLLIGIPFTSCNSRKATCYSSKYYKKDYRNKKNHSDYNVKYSFKARPVKKAYYIKNGVSR